MPKDKMSFQATAGTAGLFVVAAALRLLLFTAFPGLPNLLTGRVEISTPVTSFKRCTCRRVCSLYNHNVSPYDGGVYHQAPLLLPLFSLLPDPSTYPIFAYILYTLVDLLSANALYKIAESGEGGASRLYSSPRKEKRWSGYVVAALFLFNPFTIATCIGRPTSVFTTCAILHAVAKALSGNIFTSMLSLSFAAYLSMYPLLLLPPMVILAYDRTYNPKAPKSLAQLAGMCTLALTLTDLTPNAGLWGYSPSPRCSTASVRSSFGFFWLHPISSYTPALTIRLRQQPLAVITLLLGIFAIFKPYPSIADTSLFLSLVPCFRHVFPLLRYSFVTASVVLYGTFLGPAFYHLWIYAGSGNANFFYAITLVWSLGLSLLVSDLAFAVLRDEWEVERPEMRGKEIRQI
ncbi:hypothetical protein PG991_011078 [Apiospora marii]|uniref:GPI transamidase component PIG-U n=1 Tax=Apiospora marii TaxID=335849 RepID=A0ABR1RD56_9PEZI